MRRWEYLVLRLDKEPSSGVLMPHFINNQEIPQWEKRQVPLHQALDELGEQGWELVMPYQDLKSLLFKRLSVGEH